MSHSRREDEATIEAVQVDSYKAWEAGDADGIVANYTGNPTAIMTGSGYRQARSASPQEVGRDAGEFLSTRSKIRGAVPGLRPQVLRISRGSRAIEHASINPGPHSAFSHSQAGSTLD